MSSIFFYTDPNSINPQQNTATSGFAFGPLSSDVYQITSEHTGTNAKAVAITDGRVIALDNGTDLTLILSPIIKIKGLTNLDLPEVKYFIYKGLNRNSLIDASVPDKIASSSLNDLTRKIWETQAAYNTASGENSEPSIGALRLNFPSTSSTLIDELFEGGIDSSFEPQIVDAGDYIGDFITGGSATFGIEILLNEVRSSLTCAEAKNKNFKIDLSSMTGTTDLDAMRKKTARERILRFMDPTSFFGSLFPVREKIRGQKAEGNILKIRRADNSIDTFDGTKVYEKMLLPLYNRNRIYFDIRNEYNQSFNYFGVYNNNVKIKLGRKQDNFSEENYYNYFNQWPLLAIDLIKSGSVVYDPDDDKSKSIEIELKLPVSAIPEDNPEPLILLYHDYYKIRRKSVKKIEPHEKLFTVKKDTKDSGYFRSFVFELPNDKESADDNDQTTPVCTYIRIKVFRTTSVLAPDVQVHRQENYIDSLIFPFAVTPQHTAGLETRVFPEDLYMGTDVSIETLVNKDNRFPNTDYISSAGYAYDALNVTFFTYANRRNSYPTRKGKSNAEYIEFGNVEFTETGRFLEKLNERYTTETSASSSLLGEIHLDIPNNSNQKLYRFKPVEHVSDERSSINLFNEFSAVVLSRNTYQTLRDSVNPSHGSFNGIDPKYDISLVLRNRQIDTAPVVGFPALTLGYSVYELGLRGFEENTTTNTIQSKEWNSGILLFSYNETLNGKTKNMLIIEQGVSIDNVPTDDYLPWFKDSLDSLEVTDLKDFKKRLQDGVSFLPNRMLLEKVFFTEGDSEGTSASSYYFFLDETTGEIFFKDKTTDAILSSLPNEQVKGFLFEAATLYAVWNLCAMLTDTGEENYLYERLMRILTNNGLKPEQANDTDIRKKIKARVFNPFQFFGQHYICPDKVITPTGTYPLDTDEDYHYVLRKLFDDYTNNIHDYQESVQAVLSAFTGDLILKSSFKSEILNLIRTGNFEYYYPSGNNLRQGTKGSEILFDIPRSITRETMLQPGADVNNISSNSNLKVQSFIEPLVGKIVNEFVRELKFLINRNARCYYDIFTKNIDFSNRIEPQLRLIATGDGSSTNGFTNLAPGAVTFRGTEFTFQDGGLGVILFTYEVNKLGEVQLAYSETFPTVSEDTSVAVHLTIFGMDPNLTPDIVEIELSDPVGSSTGKKALMRFVGEQSFIDGKKKLFPETSLLGGVSVIPPHLSPAEKRVSLQPYGTSLYLLSGSTSHPDIVDANFQFMDAEGEVVGIYLAEWNNVIINKLPPYDITVRVFSGQSRSVSDPKLPIFPEFPFGEEVQVGISVFSVSHVSEERPISLKLPAQNLYLDDKFELTSQQKRDLIDKEDLYPGAKDAYAKIADLIHSGKITTGDMFFNLKGKNIGRPLTEITTAPYKHHVAQDSRFFFSLPRPETFYLEDPIGNASWQEQTPSSTNVHTPLETMYHPNDPDGNLTRLLEVPDWLPEAYQESMRFSFAEGKVIFTSNDTGSLFIDVESFVSPIWSRLDEKISNDYRHSGSGTVEGLTLSQRMALLDSLTLYNDGANPSDAYIKLIAPGNPKRGSYNPVLSCLRSFGLMEAIRDNIAFMATQPTGAAGGLGLTVTEGEAIRTLLQNVIQVVSIPVDLKIGYVLPINYAMYNKLKWYVSSTEKDLYGPTKP